MMWSSSRFLPLVALLLSVLSATIPTVAHGQELKHYASASDYHPAKDTPSASSTVTNDDANNHKAEERKKRKMNRKKKKKEEQPAALRGANPTTSAATSTTGIGANDEAGAARTDDHDDDEDSTSTSTATRDKQSQPLVENSSNPAANQQKEQQQQEEQQHPPILPQQVESFVDAMQTAQQSYQAVTAANKMAEETNAKLGNALTAWNATALTLSACEKVELATQFLTRLDIQFDRDTLTFQIKQTATATTTSNSSSDAAQQAMGDVYALLVVLTPLCLALLFFGSVLILPACVLAAALLGVFAMFHLVNNMFVSGSLDCPMKLAGSVVLAFLSAVAATTFLRFGLFSLGTLAAGGAAYLVLDAFPALDIGAEATAAANNNDGDLSAVAWMMVVTLGFAGGMAIRWYEQASLELLTAALGGMGCAYNLHALVVVRGGQLDRALVFLLAFFFTVVGWRCQRRRRLKYANYYTDQLHAQQQQQGDNQKWKIMPIGTATATSNNHPQSWQELQSSLHSMQGLLHQPPPAHVASAEQISELTAAMNKFLEKMSHLQPDLNLHNHKAANKDS